MRDSVRRVLAQAGLSGQAPPRRPPLRRPVPGLHPSDAGEVPSLTAHGCSSWCMSEATAAASSTSAMLSPGCGRGPRPRHSGGCARLRSSRRKPTVALRHLQIGGALRPPMAFGWCSATRGASSCTSSSTPAWTAFCTAMSRTVLERARDAVRFNPELLVFAAHHRYEPRPAAVARGNEKGAWSARSATCARLLRGSRVRRPGSAERAGACGAEGAASDRRWPESRVNSGTQDVAARLHDRAHAGGTSKTPRTKRGVGGQCEVSQAVAGSDLGLSIFLAG